MSDRNGTADPEIDRVLAEASPTDAPGRGAEGEGRALSQPSGDGDSRDNDPRVQLMRFLKARSKVIDEAGAAFGITTQAMIGTLGMAVIRQPEILRCSQESVLLTVLKAAKLGVDPTGANNGAHFVPFGGELTLMLGYGEVIRLMCRSGRIRNVDAEVVCEGERCERVKGTSPSLVHQLGAVRKPETYVGAYAVAYFSDGGSQYEWVTADEIHTISQSSRNGQLWKKHPGEMWKKTAVHRLGKRIAVDDSSVSLAVDTLSVDALPPGRPAFDPSKARGRVDALEGVLGVDA